MTRRCTLALFQHETEPTPQDCSCPVSSGRAAPQAQAQSVRNEPSPLPAFRQNPIFCVSLGNVRSHCAHRRGSPYPFLADTGRATLTRGPDHPALGGPAALFPERDAALVSHGVSSVRTSCACAHEDAADVRLRPCAARTNGKLPIADGKGLRRPCVMSGWWTRDRRFTQVSRQCGEEGAGHERQMRSEPI